MTEPLDDNSRRVLVALLLSDLSLLKWMIGFNLVTTVVILLKLFIA